MNKKKKNEAAVNLGRKGGEARTKKMTAQKRSKAAKHAADIRWGNK